MKKISLLLCVFYLLSCFGCATAPLRKPPLAPGVPGIYHQVERGQTLWRISKMYSVDLDELARINHIPDAASIEVGQLIFIPRAKKLKLAPLTLPASEDFIWPVKGKVVAAFGQAFENMVNKGLKIKAYGGKDVVASRSGRVVFCSPDFKGYGKTLIIDHGDGLLTVYARNSQLFIKAGDYVSQGAVIAGINDSYLHFEIRKGHIPQNPYFYLPR